MRLTRAGWACLFLLGLTLASAVTTGNNLLYLVYGLLLGALLASAFLGRACLARLEAALEWPERAVRGGEARFIVRLRNRGHAWSRAVAARLGSERAALEELGPGAEAELPLRVRLPHRGLNRLEGLTLETLYPFALLRHRRALAHAEGVALPPAREVRAAGELQADARPTGRPSLRRGRSGEEVFGVREHAPEDDARLISWKLTAKTGRPLVIERASPRDDKVTVRLESVGAGPEAERRVEEAASACRYFVLEGAEVRLVAPDVQTGYGRGLLHLDRLLGALALLGEGASARPAAGPAGRAVERPSDPLLRALLDAGLLLVYAALYLVEEIDPGLLAAAGAPLLAGVLLRRRLPWSPPQALWTAASLGVLLYVTLVDWRASGVTIANAHLLLYLMVNRSWSELSERELRQGYFVVFLAFFLVSGLTISLWYFPFFLAFALLSGAWLMTAAGARPKAEPLAAAAGAALAAAALAFAFTPRVEGLRRMNPFASTGLEKLEVRRDAAVAFSEGVSLGFFGELKRSSARALRVKPLRAPSGSEKPGPVRVRGVALETFDGRRWTKEPARFFLRQGRLRRQSIKGQMWLPAGRQVRLPSAEAGQLLAYDLVVFPMPLAVLFTVGSPAIIENPPETVHFDHADSLYFAQPYIGGAQYRLHSGQGAVGFSASVERYESEILPRFLQLPPDPGGRVAALAAELSEAAAGPLETARVLEESLRRRYDYSAYSDSDRRDLPDFLFRSRKGNCEYFATAMAVLLRHRGVPSRLVTGFYCDEWNEFGKFWDVRQGHAHAWVEAFVPGRGWLVFDPTPPAGALAGRADAVGRKLQRWFNAVQARWYVNVIGYDQYVQRHTFRRLSVTFSAELFERWAPKALLAALALLALLAAPEALRRLRARSARDDFFAAAQAAAERKGARREPHLTPREYAARAAAERPELAALRELAELHYRQRYARTLSPAEASRAWSLVRGLRRR